MSLKYRATKFDLANEIQVKALMESAWNCKLHHFPHLFAVDWYAERDDKIKAFVEFKQRSFKSTERKIVHLNTAKKFWALSRFSYIAPAFFVVRFADGVVKFIDVSKVDDQKREIAGEYNRWGPGKHDLEEMICVPIADMIELKKPPRVIQGASTTKGTK